MNHFFTEFDFRKSQQIVYQSTLSIFFLAFFIGLFRGIDLLENLIRSFLVYLIISALVLTFEAVLQIVLHKKLKSITTRYRTSRTDKLSEMSANF